MIDIRKEINKTGLSKESLGNKIGVSGQYIRNLYKRGKINLPKKIVILLDYLGYEIIIIKKARD